MKKRTARILHAVPWKRVTLYAGIALPVLLIVAQLFYPWGNTAPGAHVEGVAVGGLSKDEASQRIVAAYQATPVPVQFGDASKPYRSPTVKELGATVNADAAAASALYPWWLRLVPTSVWWAHAVVGSGASEVTQHKEAVQSYVTRELGESCSVAPKNASVTVKDDALVVVPAEDGGSCKVDDVVAKLVASTPRPAGDNTVRVAMKKIAPTIGDEQAKQLIATLEAQLSAQPAVLVGEERVALDANAVRSWLVFNEEEGVLTATIDAGRADESLTALLAKKVTKPAGVVTITTKDFTEISRTGGGDGAALNIEATAQNLTKFLRKEAEDIPVAITKIEPQKKYIRSYSATDTGLSALMQNFAESNKGVFGVSLIELSGQRRQAGYNETKSFFPASTYKVYVAYSVLRKVEAGQLRWEDQITGGRSLAKCFDDMIVLSDNPCAEALTLKIGTPTLNSDLAALGLSGSRFVGPGTHTTTAHDLSVFMASLESGQLSINGDSRNKLLSTLKRNVYRRGIPAGASGVVANKVGFIDALLHDTAVVYSPSGTYVLTIMSDGSSWGVIAELTKQIETLRNQ